MKALTGRFGDGRAVHNRLLARLKGGQSIKQVIAWAKDGLEGFAR
jgi:hypothetical protein